MDKRHQICVIVFRICLAGLNKTTKILNYEYRNKWPSWDAQCVRLLQKGLRVECCIRICRYTYIFAQFNTTFY